MTRRIPGFLLAASMVMGADAMAASWTQDYQGEGDLVVIWDGSRDVVPSKGYLGSISGALDAMNLASYADFAVRVKFTQLSGATGATPPAFKVLRVLLQSNSFDAVCSATANRPAFCSRVKRLDELLNASNLFWVGGQNPAVAAIKMIGLDVVPGETSSTWRLSAADQAVLAEMAARIGAGDIHVGLTSEPVRPAVDDPLAPRFRTMIEAVNTAPASAYGDGPSAANFDCFVIDPTNALYMYACASPLPHVGTAPASYATHADRGVFRSTDGGRSWSSANAGLGSRDVRSIAIDPRFPAVLYAAAGTDVYRSSDRGVTWSSVRRHSTSAGFERAEAVAVNPQTSAVFAAFGADVDRSTNGGQSWTTVASDSTIGAFGMRVRTLTFTNTSPSATLYADFGDDSTFGGTDLRRSRDQGVSWQSVHTPSGAITDSYLVATDPADPKVLYVGRAGTVYRTPDEGTSWVTTALSAPLAVDPLDSTRALFAVAKEVLVRSTNQTGTTATSIFELGQDIKFVRFSADGATVVVGGAGKVFRSTDRGTTFTRVTSGLPLDSVLQLRSAGGTVMAATANGGFWSSIDSGDTWQPLRDFHAVRQFSMADASKLAAVFLQEGARKLFTSNDAGRTWTRRTVPEGSSPTGVQWVVWRGDTLYAHANDRLMWSTDGGAHWTVGTQSVQFTTEPSFAPVGTNTFVAMGTLAGTVGLISTADGGVSLQTIRSSFGSPPTTVLTHVENVSTGTYSYKLGSISGLETGYVRTSGLTFSFSLGGVGGRITVLAQAPSWTAAGTPARGALVIGTDKGVAARMAMVDGGSPSARVNSVDLTTEPTTGVVHLLAATDAGIWRPRKGGTSAAFKAAGGYGSVRVIAATPAEATVNVPWLSFLTPLLGDADTDIIYRVEPNLTSEPRTGTISVGRTIVVTQAGLCSYTLAPTSATAAGAGGSASVSLTTQAGCQWVATSKASFITLTGATSGSGASTITYSVATNAGAARSGTIEIADQTFTVTQAVLPTTLTVDRTKLAFGGVRSGDTFSSTTTAQIVRVLKSGSGTTAWTASSDRPWLQVTPASGTGSGNLSISVVFDPALPVGGTLSGAVTLVYSGATSAGAAIEVSLAIQSQPTVRPFGAFETPLDGATGVAGSIPVTGWALDDLEVTRVRIFRSPVAGEAAGTLVFLGDAVLVDGARPDVQAAYPGSPRNSRAGWGYLLLTNFLPNLGNGTFTLHAIAEDTNGNSTTLGSRTITCNNGQATAPFGAIDTPGQGETVTTASYNNFGWVLSPGARRSDPPSGGSVRVVIDGTLGPTPAGWVSREDLTALFPAAQYSGIGNALGVATLDMTALANGVHTIAWLVTDNQGSASGIGSRYFTVANSALTLAPDLGLPALTGAPARSVAGRRGYDAAAPYQTFAAGADDRITIQSEELDRIELQLGASGGGGRDGETFTGHLRVGDALQALPVGSALDRRTGEFTWQPGVGFVGSYDLVFARWDEGAAVARHEVRVILNPKGSNRVGAQTIIDLPSAGAAVGRSFVVAGWAADLDATTDTGVDAVHVWAYPVNDRGAHDDPIWIGAAAYGGVRPDVAEVYGPRFRTSGYGIRVSGLAPGTYDLAVFAYSTVRHTFVPATTVRVVVPASERER